MAKRRRTRRSGRTTGDRNRVANGARQLVRPKIGRTKSRKKTTTITRKSRSNATRRKHAHASMRFFSDGRVVKANVSRKTASVLGSYLAAVRRLLDTNDAEPLEQFEGQSVKDVRGKVFPLETRSNLIYRVNAAIEPFEAVYRLLA